MNPIKQNTNATNAIMIIYKVIVSRLVDPSSVLPDVSSDGEVVGLSVVVLLDIAGWFVGTSMNMVGFGVDELFQYPFILSISVL